MKVYEIQQGSTALNGLQQGERPIPVPGPGQVQIRVRAASLNYRDQAVVTGRYFGGVVQRNTIPLSDGAGEVTTVGPGDTRVKKGDRVAGAFFQVWIDGRPILGSFSALGSPLDGMLAEYVVLDQEGVVLLPNPLTYEEGACLPCAGVTAWNALAESGRIKPGDTVLVLGTGGVSIFGLQFAKLHGAWVIVTSASDAKLERAKALGADEMINYVEHPEWHEEVMRLTGGRGVDNVIEVGGAGTLSRSIQSLGFGGQVSLIGVLTREGDTNPHGLMLKGARIQGIFVGSRAMFENMNRAISANRMHPVVDKVFPFDAVHDAFIYELEKKHFGKIVISV